MKKKQINTLEAFYKENKENHVKIITKFLKFNKHLAEDIVQESYMKAFQYWSSYNETKGSVQTWFNKILFNTLRSYQRKNIATLSLKDNHANPEQYLAQIVFLNEEISLIKNKKHRQILELFYIAGYSSREISSFVKISRSNITTICSRFRKTVKEKHGIII